MINEVRKILHGLGVDIIRHKPQYSSGYSLVKLLKHTNINLFVDIGANTGQTGLSLIESGYDKKIVSFEPVSKAFKILSRTSKRHKNWKAIKCAIGDRNGITSINISENLQSSSILPILKKHIDADPKTKYVNKEKVKIYKLDTILPKYTKQNDKIFIKIDAQGYENKILIGAKKILNRIAGLQLELSLVPLYEGEKTYKEMLKNLDKMGFELYQIYPGFTDPKSGRLLQFDGIFFKRVSPKAKL